MKVGQDDDTTAQKRAQQIPVDRCARAPERVDVVAVVVPAHDEEQRIAETLASLSIAASRVSLPVVAVVVLDACTDGTRSVVLRHAQSDSEIEWHEVSTSTRRASSSRDAGRRLVTELTSGSVAPAFVAVLSTDADTIVPPSWMADHIESLESGVDAVAGIVDLVPEHDDDGFYARWQREYRSSFGAEGVHAHVHCANLAVRLGVLNDAGGFGDLERAEDIDLWKRLGAIQGTRLRSDRASVVATSGRLSGRVTGGFSDALHQFVEPPSSATS